MITETRQILKVINHKYFDIVEEKVNFTDREEDAVIMVNAYTERNEYIDTVGNAFWKVIKYGITKFYLADPKNITCSIGFAPAKYPEEGDVDKWYGWSHRAIYGFKVGDVAKEGDCCCSSGLIWQSPEEVDADPDLTPEKRVELKERCKKEWDSVIPVGFEAKTLEDCRRMAIAFANSVS